jgi:hypothetical protein
MTGRRMNTLSECARHSAAIEVTCQACGNQAYFSAGALREWNGGDCEPDMLPFRCRCGSRHVRCRPERGVDPSMHAELPPRRRLQDFPFE